ncbi:MAG TPA: M67 family metallopeptidase [Candidatus Dormibacteraeota bacterium]|nr:M67 family metallopeptidase [Candidatus Dormibacteraeota bacterium]
MGGVIQVQASVLERMRAEAARNAKEECCGLLGGRVGAITDIFPARNILASATAYEISPEELFAIFRAMRNAQLQHLGIYHSHVASDNVPSPLDIAQAYYPEIAYFIISPRENASKPIRAFSIRKGIAKDLAIALFP